jgi:hypothetical protein
MTSREKRRNWNLKQEALDRNSGELPLEGAADLSQERILSMTGPSIDPVLFKFSCNFFNVNIYLFHARYSSFISSSLI